MRFVVASAALITQLLPRKAPQRDGGAPAGRRHVPQLREPGRLRLLLRRAAGPVALAAVFLALSAVTWRRWADPLVDFGRELYLAWRVAEGDVLYRDVAHFNGPLSVHLNALLFRAFGTSLTTLVWFNLALTVLLTALLYRTVAVWCGRGAATLGGLTFLCVAGFGHLSYIGNYNFICPYSHELTHGLFFSVVMLLLLGRIVVHAGGSVDVLFSGLCFGLVFLTKPEVFLAASAALAWTVVLIAKERWSFRGCVRAGAVFLFGAAIPVLGFLLHLAGSMPVGDALRGVAGGWPAVFAQRVAGNHYYRQVLGSDELLINVTVMFRASASVLMLAGVLYLIGRAADGSPRAALRKNVLISLLTAGAWLVSPRGVDELPRLLVGPSLPPVMLLVCGFATHRAFKTAGAERARWQLLALWSAFALALLAKGLFNVRLYHYGFALAMPAAVVALVALWSVVRRAAAGGWIGPSLVAVFVAVDCIFYYGDTTLTCCSQKTVAIGSAGDRMLAYRPLPPESAPVDWRFTHPGPAVAQFVATVEQRLPPDATLVVLPEGVMINYLTRRRNPTPYVKFMLLELQIFGESEILHAFQRSPPDYVLLLDRETYEYGHPHFGSESARGGRILQWVLARYEPFVHFSDSRTDSPIGNVLMRRSDL